MPSAHWNAAAELPTANCSSVASRVPLDVLAAVLCRSGMGVRDRAAARLVCRDWRSAVDGLSVRSLAVRSPGPGQCALRLLRRFPILQSLSLGAPVTSHRAMFSWAVAELSSLVHLTHLSLHFSSAATVRLPACLQSLSRLQALAVSVGGPPPGQALLGVTAAAVSAAGTAATTGGGDDGGGGSAAAAAAIGGPSLRDARSSTATIAHAAAAAAAVVAAHGGGGGSAVAPSVSRAAQHVPPVGLLPLLSKLSLLASLELANLAIAVPDVLAALRTAFAAAPAAAAAGGSGAGGSAAGGSGGCLKRLVLVGSSVNLTGVGDPVAVAQLAMLETLTVDSCTGADALVPLLHHLRGVRQLTLTGMDYAWAAAAGYHRRAGSVSANDLQQLDPAANGHNQDQPNPQLPNGQAPHLQDPFAVGAAGGGEGLDGGAAAAAAAAIASGRPLAFLLCLPQLSSLSLAGSFLRSLPNRDIGALTALTELDLSGNGLDDLPQGLASLPLLSRLDVSYNELVALPSWLVMVQSLESLSCHHNCLERFPALLYDLTRLSYLAIGHNRISWWPVECVLPRDRRIAAATATGTGVAMPGGGGAAAAAAAAPGSPSGAAAAAAAAGALAAVATAPLSLVSLDLSHNRLFGLPGGLPLLRALRCLRLRESLAGLDGAATARALALLGGLTALQELDLSSNHLDQHAIVPLSELRGLRQLWLADNGLEELPLGLAHLSQLTLLSLRANRFTEVPVCLRWLSSLETLDLSCNRLAELPSWIGSGGPGASGGGAGPVVNGHYNGHHTGHPNGLYSDGAGRSTSSDATGGCGSDPLAHLPPSRRPQPLHQRPQPDVYEPHGSLHAKDEPSHHHQDHPHHHQQLPPTPRHHQQPQQLSGGGHVGLVALRHLDVSQQYSVVVRESPAPYIPPRLEVQPPHCLYGPLQGDLPSELLRLPSLRCLVLQRHPLLKFTGSPVLRKLQARGVDVVHPRPLRVEALPGAAAAAFTTAAAAGGLLFPGQHAALLLGPLRAGAAGAAGSRTAAAAAAAHPSVLGPRASALLLALVVLVPLGTAGVCSALGLQPPPHAVVLVLVAAVTRLGLYGVMLSRTSSAERRQRQQAAVAAAAAAIAPGGGPGGLQAQGPVAGGH